VEIHGKKVAGILCEAVLQTPEAAVAIIGIGINVNTMPADLPAALHTSVTSMALAAGHLWPRGPLIALLLARLEHNYQLWQQGHIAALRAQWLHYGPILGRTVRFTPAQQPLTGTVVGLDEDGALRVQDHTGAQHRLVAGEVAFLAE
jgi:BirA family biotin operon repressor/biotin-[acetyl-CoA-carboxylase] ligase